MYCLSISITYINEQRHKFWTKIDIKKMQFWLSLPDRLYIYLHISPQEDQFQSQIFQQILQRLFSVFTLAFARAHSNMKLSGNMQHKGPAYKDSSL